MKRILSLLFAALCGLSQVAAANAASPPPTSAQVTASAAQIWQLLDYLAVDYGGAVAGGEVISVGEYGEMVEFAQAAQDGVARLPLSADTAQLTTGVASLVQAIDRKADAAEVSKLSLAVANALLQAYAIDVAPKLAPDAALGASLYQSDCSSCHGLTGNADGPLSAALTPKPVAFTDHARATERSVFALYQVTTQGLAGTAMPSFASRTDAERWALAFHTSQLAYSDDDRAAGAALWNDSSNLRTQVPDLETLSRVTESQLAADLGPDQARAVLAYLRSQPQVVVPHHVATGLALSRQRLNESLDAYQSGDATRAASLALSAYLDGFEPMEPALAGRNSALLAQVEKGMGEYRALIHRQAPVADVASQVAVLQGLFDASERALQDSAADATTAFLGSFTIIVREGLEALLILIAMISFLRKAERTDMLPYVHAGWTGALVAGGLTWFVATYFITISGAGREVTEGLSSLFAAALLLSVGIWMHQKSVAGRWQEYIKQKMSKVLTRRSAWFLFTLAFIAVYREVFESILCYVALWNRTNGLALLGGLGAGIVALGAVAALLLSYSKRLPIAQFFKWSSVLIAVLALVLVGKGVAALQEAGWLMTLPVPFWRSPALGIFPSAQPLVAQAVVLALIVVTFAWNRRTARRLSASRN